ncbi:MAG: FtsK/SpoIIIE domain-containing protein [Oscillospiraceae bacterium]|nr:FtsK/SpoIIIE domain-containing protein [Oscillospiraceae bacterium]
MTNFEHHQYKALAEDIAEKILKHYLRRGVDFNIERIRIIRERFIYQIKLKGTSEEQIRKHAPSVRLALKLPIFIPFKEGLTIYIAVSVKEIVYPRLPKVLRSEMFEEARNRMELPYPVGFGAVGELIIEDLAGFPHLLSGGATLSGKTVGLRVMTLSLISGKDTSEVNLVIIDAGVGDLELFDGIPHLSCPIVRDAKDIVVSIWGLDEELDRRIKLKGTKELEMLPYIVIVIDEFPALISTLQNTDKSALKRVISTISTLLQRGRHAKMHLVIAAQNPTQKSLHIDLGNCTARTAFQCAKYNNSVTILGESGAEDLLGKGDMLLMSPQHDGLKRLQGVNITENELKRAIHRIKANARLMQKVTGHSEYKFAIDKSTFERMVAEQTKSTLSISDESTSESTANTKNRKLADVAFWVLGCEKVSSNQISKKFKVSWRTADDFLEALHKAGIVDNLDTKLPRNVVAACIEELSPKTIRFMEKHGYTQDEIKEAIDSKQSFRDEGGALL